MNSTELGIGSFRPKPGKSLFLKILLDQTANNLLFPPVFVKKLLLEPKFPKMPLLDTHSGAKWSVKIEKYGEKYCFGKGWIEFVKDTKTDTGDFLVFWLTDNNTFQVSIFGPNGCEKDLSFAAPTITKCACCCGRSQIINADFKSLVQIDNDSDEAGNKDTKRNKHISKEIYGLEMGFGVNVKPHC